MKHSRAALQYAGLILGLLVVAGSAAWAQCPPLTPDPVFDFGTANVGTTTSPQPLGIFGCGGTCAGYTAAIVGPNAADFSVTNTCAPTFTTNCSISVAFTPSACGLRTAFLVIFTIAQLNQISPSIVFPAGCPIDIHPLIGVGATPTVTTAPQTFPSTCAGTSSPGITLTLPPNLAVDTSLLGIDYTATTNCPVTTGTCTVTVAFTPTAASCGLVPGTLRLVSATSGCPLVTIPLRGFTCSLLCAMVFAAQPGILSQSGSACVLSSLQLAAASTGATRCAALRCAECCAKSEVAAGRTAATAVLAQIQCLQTCFGCASFPC